MAPNGNSSMLAQDPVGAMKSGGTTPPLTGIGKVVCVTGASGYIACYIIKALLSKGYTVRGTVRNAKDSGKTAHILKLAVGSPGRLELVSADLEHVGSFDEAVAGCEYVCHVASPVKLKSSNPQKEIIDAAVQGTLNVMNAILKARTAKRVVVTSSRGAIVFGRGIPGHVYTETDWNSFDDIKIAAYPISKTLAEKAAWDIYENQPKDGTWRFELVTMLPGVALGPVLCRQQLHTSPQVIHQLLSGMLPMAPDLELEYVDVRDCADAHVAGMERESASGRYILINNNFTFLQTAKVLKKHFPKGYWIPTRVAPNLLIYLASFFHPEASLGFLWHTLGIRTDFSHEKARKELGINFRPSEESIVETAQSIVDNGWV